MMKRIVSIVLVVLMIAALFAGCSSSSPEGTYKIKSINGKDLKTYFKESFGAMAEEGQEITDDQIEGFLKLMGINSMDEFVTFTLESGGTFKDGEITISVDGETMVLAK